MVRQRTAELDMLTGGGGAVVVGAGGRIPPITAASRLKAGDEDEAAEMKICSVLLSHTKL